MVASGCRVLQVAEVRYDILDRQVIMSKFSSILIDSLRPNNSWLRPMRAAEPKDRWKYYTIRFGFVILVICLMSLFRFQPHNVLR